MPTHDSFIAREAALEPFFVGVDLGGTNIKVGLVDDLGRPLAFRTTPTRPEEGPEAGAERMGQTVRKVIEQAGLRPEGIVRVGLGSPGTMDIPAGKLVAPVNLKGWDDFPLRDRLAHHCGRPVSFANDAAAAAYGEFWVGSGREYHSLAMLTLGTGIGCGIIIGELSIDGENSHGAECGHMIIDFDDDARVCGCGRRGHLEAYASATAVIKRTEELLANGAASSLKQRIVDGERLTPKLVAEEAGGGDALCEQIVMDTARYLGVGVVNLLHTIDPAVVLLGGAMTFGGESTELGRRFLERVREEVRRRAFDLLAERTEVKLASLGADAGYIGAAGIARRDFLGEV